MLIDVITEVAATSGLVLDQQRPALVALAQRAAKKMHAKLDCNKMFREVSLVVPINKLVSIPSFIGEMRGMRQHTTEIVFSIAQMMQPRYTDQTWSYKFKNWRDVNEAPIHTFPSSQNKLTLEVGAIEETPSEIYISGQSDKGARTEEVVTMDAVSVQTENLFGPEIHAIGCPTERAYDIIIKDIDGNEIAILYNNENATRYKIIDVSEFIWSPDTSGNDSIIDVCYKVKATALIKDSDMFYTGNNDYDEAWVMMCMHLYTMPLENREAESARYLGNCLAEMLRVRGTTEKSDVGKIKYGRNKFYGLNDWPTRYYPGACTNVDNTNT